MAITNTSQSKEFVAGSSPIILKGDYRPKQDMQMASMDENEREFMRLVEEFMERGFNQQEAIEAAKEEFDKKAMADGGRAQYGLGSIVKSIGKAVKGVVKGVKKNPLLAAAALNFAPMLAGGKPFLGLGSLKGSMATIPGFSNLLGLKEGADAMNALKVGGAGAAITGLLAGMEQQEGESNQEFGARKARVRDQLNVQFKRLYPQEGNESDEDYNIRITAMVEAADDQTVDVGNMAEGGRVSYASGSDDYEQEFMKLVGEFMEQGFSQQEAIEAAKDELERLRSKFMAYGGRVNRARGSDEKVEMASGIEGLPINVNSKGVKEVDLRESGGFIPPVGVKEKADDIPAMLSNNEFVFTADAVRAAGGGSVNKGAQRMYDLMKNLESKVV